MRCVERDEDLCQFDRTLLCLDVASARHVLWEGHLTLLVLRLTLGHVTTGWGRGRGRGGGVLQTHCSSTQHMGHSSCDEVCNVLVLAEIRHLWTDQLLHRPAHPCGDHLDVAALGEGRGGRAGEDNNEEKCI